MMLYNCITSGENKQYDKNAGIDLKSGGNEVIRHALNKKIYIYKVYIIVLKRNILEIIHCSKSNKRN